MIEYKILKKSKKTRARLGILKTPHGEVETPALVPVATQAAVKTQTPEQAMAAGSQLLICNTYHLHLKPGEKIVKASGGLHKFMGWQKPLMTDSGGFQVFSLGFGRDLNMGKIISSPRTEEVTRGQQPKLLKISDKGVEFTSHLDGSRLFLGPKESIRIQEALGADIIFAFDECPPPVADKEYAAHSMERTHRWAKTCLQEKKSKQAIYGIVQGGKFKDLRKESAQFIGSLPFDGIGIGGELGFDKKEMFKMLPLVTDALPEHKPRHLLGNGHIEDLRKIFASGVDTLDCIVPTHYARHGVAFTSQGRIDLNRSIFLRDRKPLDPTCPCFVCQNHSRSYICHLFRAKEIGALQLTTFHNLSYFNAAVASLREEIKKGKM